MIKELILVDFIIKQIVRESTLGNFEGYDSVLIYAVSDFVKAENGKFYRSLQNDNQGNDPASQPSN